jgi:hypothetical protein
MSLVMTMNLFGSFFPAYKSDNGSFSPDTFACAERTVEKLLAARTTSEHPGMLLGKVQSGKTRTFISIMALAFDNGYDITIVLSKNSKALIEQTAKRLRTEFRQFLDDGVLELYDIMESPKSFTEFELEAKMIFVAKKESNNLKRLIALFENHPTMAAKRVLVIDDEADNASIGYVRKEGLIEANKISSQISDLRSKIETSSFLQVTATPYSLYLQPTVIEVGNVADFKPVRPAFTELVPVPPEYVGGEAYFGPAAKSEEPTVERLIHHAVDAAEFDRLKKHDGRSLKLDQVLTSPSIKGYRAALLNFMVGGCILRMNGFAAGLAPAKLRYSFLLHSEAGKEAHEWQEKLTGLIIDALKAAAANGDAIFDGLIKQAYDDLAPSIALAGSPVPELDVVQEAVQKAIEAGWINICKVNSDDDVATMLDDSGQLKLKTPLNIFLGGQVLDRGVTLANLIGFYYGRRPNKFQQDTVLQHSRMYGYRRKDLGATRFYTAASIRHAMQQMEDFDGALRGAIEAGGDQAVQFIRKAQDGSIVPCSPNKIMIANTSTLQPGKRILPIGFQTGYRTGKQAIGATIDALDVKVLSLCGFNATHPVLVPLKTAFELLDEIETTLFFEDEDAPNFDWEGAKAALTHLSYQHSDKTKRGHVLLWAARDRKSSRKPTSALSHSVYIETPDSPKTEGVLATLHAIDTPILYLLRQDGHAAQGWRDTPFYWPIIRAQSKALTAIYTSATLD